MPAYLNPTKLYKYHVANLRSLQIALDNTALSARKVIAEQNVEATASFTRLYAFLVGAWAETRLQKLLNENGAFDEGTKGKVLSQSTQLDQWIKTVELSFRHHYKVPHAVLSAQTLPHSSFQRYTSLITLINDDLKPVIEMRNKLAHGQWIYPLNSGCTELEGSKYMLINGENLLSLQYKRELISTIAEIVHDLAVSCPTFERDFDSHYKQIMHTKANLANREFAKYKKVLIEKRQRGIAMRRKIITPS